MYGWASGCESTAAISAGSDRACGASSCCAFSEEALVHLHDSVGEVVADTRRDTEETRVHTTASVSEPCQVLSIGTEKPNAGRGGKEGETENMAESQQALYTS